MIRRPLAILNLVLALCAAGACGPSQDAAPSAATAPASGPSADAEFTKLVDELLDDTFQRAPTQATYLGIHTYDDKLEDLSRQGIDSQIAAVRAFRDKFSVIDPKALSLPNQLDREQVLLALDGQLLMNLQIRPWATNPDIYSSGVTQSAYIMVKRSFAPPETRLKALITRERLMVRNLEEARKNLDNPPDVLTKIAIEQVDGNRDFFVHAVPDAFKTVTDNALLAEFSGTNKAVIDALAAYKTFLTKELLPKSKGQFALGGTILSKKFANDEMVDLPLDRLLAIAHADLAHNQQQFKEIAAKLAPGKAVPAFLASITTQHPPPAKLLETTQSTLDSIRQFIESKQLLTLPKHVPAKVEETPPFLRAVTSASMDTPGPFETKATEAFYNMTLPDPAWPKPQVESFMRQWYYPMIANVSVHEVYPGHYVQFLYGPQFPSKVRKVFGAASNAEGWAHYCEQMMLDEGFHADDPHYRLAQLQDALLRDVRFIAGIQMHSQGMTVAEAQKLFETEAYEPPPVALAEAKRGTSDPTYGYYTMGKLMILKLRDDVRAKRGAAFTLQGFHDEFLKLGPLPLPLIRRAMLGETGGTGASFPVIAASSLDKPSL
jgi:uncharacterized protein (DUF885 family)